MGSIILQPLFIGVDGKAYGVDGVDAWKHTGIFFFHLTIFVIILYASGSQTFCAPVPQT